MRRTNLRFLLLYVSAITLPLACATAVDVETSGGGGDGGEGGDASVSSSSTGMMGPCIYAPECAHLTDACSDGACVNSVCVKIKNPTKEGVPCDDGKECTQNDTCSDGVCTGGLKGCPASSNPCMVGQCDVETDTCIEVPGNEGKSCVDTDPCTQTALCKGGACSPGIPTDCSFLNDFCTVGYCKPGVGCQSMPANDGSKCDDGLFCTVDDACKGGVCSGAPNMCAAPGDVCMIGTCNEGQNTCQAVPGNDGAQCNDQSACTMNETCSNGLCGGGVPTNNGGQCDDGNACTTSDVCANGVCAGTPLAACVNGDGCCPAGCDVLADNDCGGAIYMTSSNGTQGFYGYTIQTNAWAILPSPPAVTYSQLTTDGTNVLMLGNDNVIYSYSPATSQWSPTVKGPGPMSNNPIGFFKWTPSGYYYVKDGEPILWYSPLGSNMWSIAMLPVPASCAGTFDPASGNLYIRAYANFGLMVWNAAQNTLLQFWQNGMVVGENSRTGSYYAGFFYEREWDQPLYKVDVTTGVATNTGVTPSEGHTASDVNLATGDIYIGPYTPTGTTFQVYNAPTNMLKTLAPAPVSLTNHSTIVYVK